MSKPLKKKADPTAYKVPRNFKLLDELEMAEKDKHGKKYGDESAWINLGLNGQDATFTHWNASIIPHQGGHIGERIYNLKITAGPGYPDDPPLVRFVQKVAMPCVNAKGQVEYSKLKNYKWTEESSIFEVLLAVRKMMQPYAQACAKIKAGTTYN
mmetsp:Transcript_103229/g.126160  ORF Transcript_103229/g.126160 Transcript_103229/m.126160 type:complete len:155 (+) Transcript_103229:50-514(+)